MDACGLVLALFEQHLGEVEACDGVGGCEVDGLLEMRAGASLTATERAREFVFETCEDAERPGGVIGGVQTDGALERATCAQGEGQRTPERFDARTKRKINAEPEVSLDAARLKTRGTRAGRRAASMKGAYALFFRRFLTEKKERAAKSPSRAVVVSRRSLQKFD